MSSFTENPSHDQQIFLQNIKSWVEHNSRVDILQQKLKEERKEIELLTPQITGFMESNNMTNTVINLQDSKLKYTETSTRGGISLELLEVALKEFFNGDVVTASNCLNYVKNKRPMNKKIELKRTFK